MDIRFFILCLVAVLSSACAQVYKCERDLKPPSLAELAQSRQEGEKESGKPYAFLGVAHRVIETDELQKAGVSHGYVVDRVVPGSAADTIGMLAGDIILEFDGINLGVVSEEDRNLYLTRYIQLRKKFGDRICLKILRQVSDIRVQGHGETLFPKSKKALENILAEQPPDKKLTVTIDNTIRILTFEAILGEKKSLAEKDLPANSDLFPEYEIVSTTQAALMQNLIDHFDLRRQYQDILGRYSEDELWDDGFRLRLFRYLHRDPLKFIPVIEARTARLEELGRAAGLGGVLREGADMLDTAFAPAREDAMSWASDLDYFKHIQQVIDTAWELRQNAFAELSAPEIAFLEEELVLLMDRFSHSYYIDRPDEPDGRIQNQKIIELVRKVDFSSLFLSASVLAKLADREWLAGFGNFLQDGNFPAAGAIDGVTGDVLHTLVTRAGPVIIGGAGRNVYTVPAAAIIDLGGDDLYMGDVGLVNGKQQISAVIDLGGSDEYMATKPFAQGSAVLGIGLLYDLAGNDLYVGARFAQGCAVLGVGMLGDLGGDDRYFGEEFNQGAAFWGAGILLDAAGNDYYQSNLFAQGVGGVKGMGALLDNEGDDFYFAGGRDGSSYGTSGQFNGSSQGLGIGFRGYVSGGIGLLLDGNGNDTFWAGNFSQGTGYFFGMGIIRNFGAGDDIYTASRYGQGASAHSAAGILVDDGGNDRYRGYHVALQGAAWDLGMAALVDKDGNDEYRGENGFSQAAASHNGMAFFIDEAGIDRYFGEQAPAANNDYHGGASLSFFIDAGGDQDAYTSGINDSVTMHEEYGIRADLKDSVQKVVGDALYFK